MIPVSRESISIICAFANNMVCHSAASCVSHSCWASVRLPSPPPFHPFPKEKKNRPPRFLKPGQFHFLRKFRCIIILIYTGIIFVVRAHTFTLHRGRSIIHDDAGRSGDSIRFGGRLRCTPELKESNEAADVSSSTAAAVAKQQWSLSSLVTNEPSSLWQPAPGN